MGQPVVHFEVQGSDREALSRFYQQLFDWNMTDISQMNYTMVETGGDGGINGGIGDTPCWPIPRDTSSACTAATSPVWRG
jgi:predicted enzyme related to lactoylglutathione lyase